MVLRALLSIVIGLKLMVPPSLGLDNGLALTPPMGWMSWQRFRCIVDCINYPDECISEKLFRDMADLMASEGYLDAGYEYLIIDDCWLAKERGADGKLQPDPVRFPNGIKALADYVHSKGLKFGIYEDYGTKTCAGYPGSLGYLDVDAQTFADWTVDYVKFDGCHAETGNMSIGYPEFGRQLNATGRPMIYSCSWPAYTEPLGIPGDYETLTEYCNLWRNWDDIDDAWDSVTNITDWFSKHQDRIAKYSGPGHWNDPDMLLIGNFGLSYDQSKAQMAIWAVMAAPLLMSVDFRTIKPEFKEILLNKDIIAINQDKLGVQGLRVYNTNKTEIWTKPILPKVDDFYTYAVAIVSRRIDGYPRQINVTFTDIGLHNPSGYVLKDLYEPKKIVAQAGAKKISVKVNPSGVVFLHAQPFKN